MSVTEAPRGENNSSPQELRKSSLESSVYLFNEWATEEDFIVCKSWFRPDGSRYHNGERFIIYAQTRWGTFVEYHEAEFWDLFRIPEWATGPNLDFEYALEKLCSNPGGRWHKNGQ